MSEANQPYNPAVTGHGRDAHATLARRGRRHGRPARGFGRVRPDDRSVLVHPSIAIAHLPASALLGLIWLYRKLVSPVLPVVLGPSCGCRFHPTCSHYAAEAVRTHGAIRGAWLAARRLLKCTPLHPGGFDPVPAPGELRHSPTCVRMKNARPARHERTQDCLSVSPSPTLPSLPLS